MRCVCIVLEIKGCCWRLICTAICFVFMVTLISFGQLAVFQADSSDVLGALSGLKLCFISALLFSDGL